MKFRGYFLALAGMLLVPAGSPGGELPQTNLAGKSEAAIETLEREVGGASWWVRIGDTLYSPAFAGTREIDGEIGHYGLLCGARLPEEWIPFRAGGGHGYHIVYLPDGKVPVVETAESEDAACRAHAHGLPVPIRPGLSLNVRVRAQKSTGRSGSLSFATVEGLVNQVDKDRYYSTIDALAGFGSRSIYAAGVASARDYIKAEFEALGLTVTTPSFSVQGTPAYNVVGKLEGSAYPGEFLVVGAHYDSRPYSGPAPGAEDNASGTASVIEMARILAPFGSERTVYFVAFSGEEKGLYGSADFVADLTASQRASLEGALIMDMVSFTRDAQLDVLLETNPTYGSALRSEMAAAAADFTTLAVFNSNNPFGSDHMPFLNAHLPSVLAIENDWDYYDTLGYYHTSLDTMSHITREQGEQITRMNVGAIARLANPGPPAAVSDWEIFQ